MEEIKLLDVVERYLNGEMTPEERLQFDEMRKTSSEIDQLVVTHTNFLTQLNDFGDRKHFSSTLKDVHTALLAEGAIKENAPKAKIIDLFKKYRKVWAVAACIAGIIAITISGLVAYFIPNTKPQLEQLKREVFNLKKQQNALTTEFKNTKGPKAPANALIKFGGTGFLINGKGYLVTNAHVVKDGKTIIVQNKEEEYKANIVFIDVVKDIAILKIEDTDFKPITTLPYGFKKNGAELGEQIFTLGFPRDEIVYGEGYMSAHTGYNGDTMSCQIAVAANPGNSGGPVFNKNGEVIGILSTRQLQTQGFVFAVRAKNIFKLVEELKKDNTVNIKINSTSLVKGIERTQQIKKIADYVFLVKTY